MAQKGFFSIPKVEKPKKTPTKKFVSVEELMRAGEPDCATCKLDRKCKTPKMKVGGEGRKGVLLVAEASGANEDTKGTQLVGQAGQLLEKDLREATGLELHRDCHKINAVNCRPENNRTPTPAELKCCKPYVMQVIQDLKPKAIWLLGDSPNKQFYEGRFKKEGGVTRWLDWFCPDHAVNTFVTTLYHPSFILRNEKDAFLRSEYRRQLKRAWENTQTAKWPQYNLRAHVLTDYMRVVDVLVEVLTEIGKIGFDYETTGLKPYRAGHRIETMSLAYHSSRFNNELVAFSFPFQRQGHWGTEQYAEIKKLWCDILAEKEIKKSAHNLKFEDVWSRVILGIDKVRGWEDCTMNSAHILDSRKYITGLKFQAYANFGVEGYDREVKWYLETTDNLGFNKIADAPLDKLLQYGAYDSFYEVLLEEKQAKIFAKESGLEKARKFYVAGVQAMANMQIRGIGSDEAYYKDQDERLTKRINRLDRVIVNGLEGELYKKDTGTEFNCDSPKQLQHLLVDILHIPLTKTTKTGYSVDEGVLKELDVPVVKNILAVRKLNKLKGTYMGQFLEETYNGKIHPFFDLHKARTYRSSSSEPNFQNIPVRDKEAKKICRSGIIPMPGCKIMESDYAALEVRIAACVTEDPVLVKYLRDDFDMHKEQAAKIFKCTPEEVHKDMRFYTKNGFVFPSFYGSWFKSTAENIWPMVAKLTMKDGSSLEDHMRRVRLGTFDRFVDHMERVEKEFWNKYRVFKKWQERVQKTYLEKGYVETMFGHRRTGWMKKNEILNTPIQGTGFQCLLWSCIEVEEIAEAESWESYLMGQIHDSMLSNLEPEEEEMCMATIKDVACKQIVEENKWLIVPLDMEFELTEVDKPWYTKEVKNEEKAMEEELGYGEGEGEEAVL